MGFGNKTAVPLSVYIRKEFNGSKAEFARAFGFYRQNISVLLRSRAVVIDGEVYRPLARHRQP